MKPWASICEWSYSAFVPSLLSPHPTILCEPCQGQGQLNFTLSFLKKSRSPICSRPSISSFTGPTSTTLNAHRLISKAYEIGGSGAQSSLITLIFRAYYEDDLDIADSDVLSDATEQSGVMSKVEVSVSPAGCLPLASIGDPPFHFLWSGAGFSIQSGSR